MSNEYDRKLTHQFFYSGFHSHGDYRNSHTWFRGNAFYSYSTCIGIVLDSKLVKREEYNTGKQVPQKILLLDTATHSVTTASHIFDLRRAMPRDYETIILPFSYAMQSNGESFNNSRPADLKRVTEVVIKHLLNAATQGYITTQDQRDYFNSCWRNLMKWQAHFGKGARPKGWSKILATRELLDNPERYEAFKRKAIKEQAAKTRAENKKKKADNEESRFKTPYVANLDDIRNCAKNLSSMVASAFRQHICDHDYGRILLLSELPQDIKEHPVAQIYSTNPIFAHCFSNLLRTLKERLPRWAYEAVNWSYFTSTHTINTQTYLASVGNWNGARGDCVAPIVVVRDDHVTVNHNKMITNRGVQVSTDEVKAMLKLRKHGDKMLGKKFSSGWTIIENSEEWFTVGCHSFAQRRVDALQNLMLNYKPEEIEALYTDLYLRIKKLFTDNAETTIDAIVAAATRIGVQLKEQLALYAKMEQDVHAAAEEACKKAGYKWQLQTYISSYGD